MVCMVGHTATGRELSPTSDLCSEAAAFSIIFFYLLVWAFLVRITWNIPRASERDLWAAAALGQDPRTPQSDD